MKIARLTKNPFWRAIGRGIVVYLRVVNFIHRKGKKMKRTIGITACALAACAITASLGAVETCGEARFRPRLFKKFGDVVFAFICVHHLGLTAGISFFKYSVPFTLIELTDSP